MAGSIAKLHNCKWRARYRDEAGRERARHFDLKVDAQRWLDEIASSVLTGNYVDPGADYYEERYRERVIKQLQRRAGQFGFALQPAEAVS